MCVRAAPAFAYRPFDGTDAAVTEPGQAEVELQPAGRLQEGSQSFLVAPGIVINFGVVKGLELVFGGALYLSLHGFRGFDGAMRIEPGRKTHSEEGAAACEVIVYLNGRVMGVSNLFDDRQTQTGAPV